MRELNLPVYDFRYKTEGGIQQVLDIYRKRFVVLTPEEEVRQRFARYLLEEKGFPAALIMTEFAMKLNKMTKRADIVVHKPAGSPVVLVECKAPEVKIAQAVFDQAARYNLVFRVKYLMVTNGLKHYCCQIDFDTREVEFLSDIPHYNDL